MKKYKMPKLENFTTMKKSRDEVVPKDRGRRPLNREKRPSSDLQGQYLKPKPRYPIPLAGADTGFFEGGGSVSGKFAREKFCTLPPGPPLK